MTARSSVPPAACLPGLPARPPARPQVELPLGATEDRICGTIDIEKALSEGIKAYEPGLLVRGGGGDGGAGMRACMHVGACV